MNDRFPNDVGVLVPRVLLPKAEADFSKWAVVACDQYTSQPDYWQNAATLIGDAPSALHLILPEAFLGKDGEEARIASIKRTMRAYLDNHVLLERPQGFVLVTRTVAGKTRTGLVMALDLEAYDYQKGSETLIRATEGTIVERIPPRLKIRSGAPIELPHILVLIDDEQDTVIGPVRSMADQLPCLYDTELMLGGGHVTGRLVSEDAAVNGILNALKRLADREAFAKRYRGAAPLLFAMGDGNHSLATAKADWERIKATLTERERAAHPARYALVEVENIHDEGIVFEPIHRVVFGLDDESAPETLLGMLQKQNGAARIERSRHAASGGKTHVLPFTTGRHEGAFVVESPAAQLAVGTLQNAIDAVIKAQPAVEVDYIHGADVVYQLAEGERAMGFLLPAMGKHELFPTVVYEGALPRKTFSMGEANEKRYYMECRRIDG